MKQWRRANFLPAAQELVQVESLAQMGVQLLLFTLGLEFSLAKLRVVRNVALLGAPPRPCQSCTPYVSSACDFQPR